MYQESEVRSTLFAASTATALKKKKHQIQPKKKQKAGSKKKPQEAAKKLDRALVDPVCGVTVPASVKSEKFYLTTAINYTNGPPHMGHAYEAITSDVIVRYHRTYGRDVFFLTGADEHGQKVEQSAVKSGVTPQAIADKFSDGFKGLNKSLNISNDFYIRTTMKHHNELARKIWCKVRDKGDIYLKDYVGWYNVHEEQYVTDQEAEANDFKDEHGRPLEKKAEESYFFRMSKYQKQLIQYITVDNPTFIQPETRKKEMLSFLEEPLLDLCISRTVCQWGVKCPKDPDYKGDKNHVMYVWFDALTNYLSGINYLREEDPENWSRFWPVNVHIIGKDIVRFHTVIWPTMLMSAEIPLPQSVFGHGFVVAEDGMKMSKTLGNVVDPVQMLKLYPADALRFYIARSATYGSDLPFSEKALCGICNAALKDGLGNLIHRGTSLCQSYCDGKVPHEEVYKVDGKVPIDIASLVCAYELAFSARPADVPVAQDVFHKYADLEQLSRSEGFQIQSAGEAIVEGINQLNKYIQELAPWKIKEKDEQSAAKKRSIVRGVLEGVYVLAHFLRPFCPESMDDIFHKLGVERTSIVNLSAKLDNLPPGTVTYVGPILYHELQPGVGVVQQEKGVSAKSKSANAADYQKALAAKKAKKEQAKKSQNQQDDPNQPVFTKLDFRVGKIVKVWHHETLEKLFCEEIDIGEDKPRQIASGLREHYQSEDLQDRLVVVLCNLKPRKLGGFPSNGMVICATGTEKVEILDPPKDAKIGTRLGLENMDPHQYPPAEPNRVARKKIFEAVVAKKLCVNGDKLACWDGKQIHADGKQLTVDSLTNVPLS